MNHSAETSGLAVFMRTDTLDFAEYSVPFSTLAEMAQICTLQPPYAILQQVVIRSVVNNEPCSITLSFVGASKGGELAHLSVA